MIARRTVSRRCRVGEAEEGESKEGRGERRIQRPAKDLREGVSVSMRVRGRREDHHRSPCRAVALTDQCMARVLSVSAEVVNDLDLGLRPCGDHHLLVTST